MKGRPRGASPEEETGRRAPSGEGQTPPAAEGDPPRRVVVTAATGYTGGLVAEELARSELPFLLTARRPDALEERAREVGGAPARVVDVTEPASLEACLRPGDVVVNCAGPFTELGGPVVRCCVGAGAHYLDTTGEQPFMKEVEDRWGGAARDAGVAVVNGMAFEYALGDAAGALAARGLERPLERLDVVYGWRAGAEATTPGTRASMVRVLSRRGWALEGGRWRREPVARRRCRVRMPDGARRQAMSFPAGEVVTVPRHVDVRTVRGWIVAGGGTVTVAHRLSPLLPAVAGLLEPLLDRLARSGPAGPDEAERRRGRFDVVAAAAGDAGRRRSVAVGGRDPYGVTASLIVRAARALLAADRPDGAGRPGDAPAGVAAPSQLLDPEALLGGLDAFDVAWGEAPDAGPLG